MQVENPVLGKLCSTCGRNNASNQQYCLGCGKNLEGGSSNRPTPRSVTMCPKCGIDDVLNEKFCINCGSPFLAAPAEQGLSSGLHAQIQTSSKLRTSFSRMPAMEISPKGPQARPEKPPSSSYGLMVAAIIGIVGGIVVAGLLYQQKLFDYVLFRCSWPRTGLVVYANPTSFQARLESADKSKILFASSDAHGALSVLNVPAGAYRIFIQSPGYRTIVQSIQIVSSGPTVIGFPSRIDLPKKSSDTL